MTDHATPGAAAEPPDPPAELPHAPGEICGTCWRTVAVLLDADQTPGFPDPWKDVEPCGLDDDFYARSDVDAARAADALRHQQEVAALQQELDGWVRIAARNAKDANDRLAAAEATIARLTTERDSAHVALERIYRTSVRRMETSVGAPEQDRLAAAGALMEAVTHAGAVLSSLRPQEPGGHQP